MLKMLKKSISILLVITYMSVFVFSDYGVIYNYEKVYAYETLPPTLVGDVNCSGKIEVADLILLAKFNARKIELNDQEYANAKCDVSTIGVGSSDILALLKHLADSSIALPFGGSDKKDKEKEEFIKNIKEEISKMDFSVINSSEPAETKITAEMAKFIDELETPTAVYEFFINAIQTEFYIGSRKGAIGTFEQLGGNDIDQASLLIAALRYMGYEANYVRGYVSLTYKQAMELTGTTNINKAMEFLNLHGHTAEYINSQQIQVFRTWVEAIVSLSLVNDTSTFVKLDVSFKNMERVELLDLFAIYDFENIKNNLNMSYLPSELPYTISMETDSFSDIPLEISEGIEFYVDGEGLTYLKSAEMYGKKLVLEYEFDEQAQLKRKTDSDSGLFYPKTILDIPKFGIYNYKVQATLKVDDKKVGNVGHSVCLGEVQDLGMIVHSSQMNVFYKWITAGSIYSIIVDSQNISGNELLKVTNSLLKIPENESFDSLYCDKYLGTTLSAIGKIYMSQLNISDKLLAEAYNVYQEQNLSICIVSFDVDRTYQQGGYFIDYVGNSVSPVITFDNNKKNVSDFKYYSGVQSSYIEGFVLQEFTEIECVSTMKIMDIAKKQGIDILYISKNSVGYDKHLETLRLNNIDRVAYEEIVYLVSSGSNVTIPAQDIIFDSWTGIGYIIDTNENYSFIISGILHGGGMIAKTNILQIKSVSIWSWLFGSDNIIYKAASKPNKPGFKTEDAAAYDFAKIHNGISIMVKKEYAANIYKNAYGNFEWKQKVIGTTGTVSPAEVNEQYGIHTALVHTHGASYGEITNDVFSPTDIQSAERLHIMCYLSNPKGELKKYQPSDGFIGSKEFILTSYTDIPFDPEHPERQNE